MGKQRFINRYIWLVVAAGVAMFVYSALNLPFAKLDFRFCVLFLLTFVISSRIAIKVPRVNTTITVADSFVFLTLLLYGPEAAVIVAAADGLSAGLHISKRWITVLFNAAAAGSAAFTTGAIARLFFGPVVHLDTQSLSTTIVLLSTVAVSQYAVHTWLVAICLACKSDRPVWQTWSKHYLWSSLTYFIGAFLAGAIISLEGSISFYAVLAPLPMLQIIPTGGVR